MLHANTKAPLLIAIDEELHDVRRVLAQGEEDDLRGALQIMIRRVEEMKSLIAERERIANDEKEKALAEKDNIIDGLRDELIEKDVELGVTRSNLRMVSANNEMLEQALKDGGGGLGWGHRRGESAESSQSQQQHPQPKEDSRFFNKFRFASRPGTPSGSPNPTLPHTTSTPNLRQTSIDESDAEVLEQKEREEQTLKAEIEKREKREKELQESLEKERQARTTLEAELESLSQALFEEANKMVSTERRRRAETEEELREALEEKEALKNALRLVEGENVRMRVNSLESLIQNSHSRSSSMRATKSRPSSQSSTILQRPRSPTTSESPSPDPSSSTSSLERAQVQESLDSLSSTGSEDNTDVESSATPSDSLTSAEHQRTPSAPWEADEPSPWADIPGSPPPPDTRPK